MYFCRMWNVWVIVNHVSELTNCFILILFQCTERYSMLEFVFFLIYFFIYPWKNNIIKTFAMKYFYLPCHIAFWERANNPQQQYPKNSILFMSNSDAFINQRIPMSINTVTNWLPPNLLDLNKSNADSGLLYLGTTITAIDGICHGNHASWHRRLAELIGELQNGLLILLHGKSLCV